MPKFPLPTPASLGTAILNRIDPELAHAIALLAFKTGLYRQSLPHNPRLHQKFLGRLFENPVGLAPGFDKDADCLPGLAKLGFGFLEAGAVTLKPQPGNPKPRVFRLPEDGAVINRMGFNGCGCDRFRRNLKAARRAGRKGRPQALPPIGINLGLNKTSTTPIEDFTDLARRLEGLADYLTINVSSPNTPGLRDLQNPAFVSELLESLGRAAPKAAPVFLKFSPDMPDADYAPLIERAVEGGAAGIVLANTTLARDDLQSSNARETGGLSGAPLKDRAMELLKLGADVVKGRCLIISNGGIDSGDDVFDRLRAGAHLVQIYTAFIRQGPQVLSDIQRGLLERMDRENVSSLSRLERRSNH